MWARKLVVSESVSEMNGDDHVWVLWLVVAQSVWSKTSDGSRWVSECKAHERRIESLVCWSCRRFVRRWRSCL